MVAEKVGKISMSIRTTFVLAVVLSLVAGYFLMARDRDFTLLPEDQPWFYTITEKDIDNISITRGERNETFIKTQTGWVFDRLHQIPVDLSRWGGVTLLLSGPKSHRVFAEEAEDLATMGLVTPQTIVDMTLRGDRKVRLSIGDWTPDRAYNYSINRGDPRLYLVDSSWGLVLGGLAMSPPFPKWYFDVDPARARFVQIKHDGKEAEFFFELVSEEWRISGDQSIAVDKTYWANVYPHLGGPAGLKIIEPSIGLDEFAKYGLADPIATISVHVTPPPTIEEGVRAITTEIGSPLPDGTGYYAKVQGQSYLLSVDNEWYSTMTDLVLNPPPAEKKS